MKAPGTPALQDLWGETFYNTWKAASDSKQRKKHPALNSSDSQSYSVDKQMKHGAGNLY